METPLSELSPFASTDSPASASSEQPSSKKRRIPGACDVCKRKKIKCDSGERPGNRCSNCTQSGVECTHKEVVKNIGSAKGYVESLENRLEKMEQLVKKLLPGVDIARELESLSSETSPHLPALTRNDDNMEEMLVGHMAKLQLNPNHNRFFGKSSGYHLVRTALDLKYNAIGLLEPPAPLLPAKRDQFWVEPKWRTPNPDIERPPTPYVFPDADLIPSLVDAYFETINLYHPLLHRPTFEESMAKGLHLEDRAFGGIVLLVCALGARSSKDYRIYTGPSTLSAGWKWFNQVLSIRPTLIERATLFEIQTHVLYVHYMQSTETPQGCWAQIGFALRLAQEVGAHLHRRCEKPNAENELWKRAFWVLLSLDRSASAFVGRPCGLQSGDFDVELPIDCDDEYWDLEDHELNFRQPAGKPSKLSYFNCYLGLMDITAFAIQNIYPTRKRTPSLLNSTPQTNRQVIAALDSAMNHWMDSIPDHLRWKPLDGNKAFLLQSAALYTGYYNLQIFIHRPFIPSPRNPDHVAFPSLAICTNAARSTCHVLGTQKIHLDSMIPSFQITAFQAAVVLLLNIWNGKRTGAMPHPRRELEDVQNCMDLLKACEDKYATAGRLWDILYELASAGDLGVSYKAGEAPQNSAPKQKRPREGDDTASSSASIQPSHLSNQPRTIAGSRRFQAKSSPRSSASPEASQTDTPSTPVNFALPMYGNELGRLPVYGQFGFSDAVDSAFSQGNALTGARGDYEEPLTSFLPNLPAHGEGYQNLFGHAALGENQDIEGYLKTLELMDPEAMMLWSNAPMTFELDDWGSYINSVDMMTRRQDAPFVADNRTHLPS